MAYKIVPKNHGTNAYFEWQETASEPKEGYRKEHNSERKTRLYAFWNLQLGKSLKDVAELVGMGYHTPQRWVGWYQLG